ncbi:MAG: Fe-S cluster assembly protein SufD, partial [Halodesulfurarchaeum sp.]|nr:Fe-S cluster assembly protein SufD [Halodesulfurarchaeum sp.]
MTTTAQFREAVDRGTVRALADQFDEPDWMVQKRLEALEAVEALDFPPVIQTPGRKWTDLESLDFEALVDPLSQPAESQRSGGDAVEVLSMDAALERLPALVQEYYGSVIDTLDNRLIALATALRSGGTVIHVPEGVDAGTVKIETAMEGRSRLGYTLVVAEPNSSVLS